MKRYIFKLTRCLIIIPGWVAVSSVHAQNSEIFANTPLGQYINSNPQEFSKIDLFVTGIGSYAESLLQQSLSENSHPNKLNTVKALIACQDLSGAFSEATDSARSSTTAIANYNAAMMQCRTIMPKLKPYMDSDNATMMLWQRKMTPLLQIPRTLPFHDIQRAYHTELDNKASALINGGSHTATSKSPSPSKSNLTTELPPLPSEPFTFNWQELDEIKGHIRAALKAYQLHQQPGECQALADSENNVVSLYKVVNELVKSCKSTLYTKGYAGNLINFSLAYRKQFYEIEQKNQASSIGTLPLLPSQPFRFVKDEVLAIKSYLSAASAQSLDLSYSQQVGMHKGEVCKTDDVQKLGTDLSAPFVKQYWQQVIGQLQSCATFMSPHNRAALEPLQSMLKDYMAVLQAQKSRPFFGK
ncbi:hypothetical protein [Alteromonas sp. CYL-A6]|uniref:hypothetical protein n=1 Tax=Alteromonas nitratireducens TaxID=3390813 RepID=UPI0034A96350